jgi:hypothetical protein
MSWKKYEAQYEAMRIKDTESHDCFSNENARPLNYVFTVKEVSIIHKAKIFDEGEDVWACKVCKDLVPVPDLF